MSCRQLGRRGSRHVRLHCAPRARSSGDRARASGARGRRFESCRAHDPFHASLRLPPEPARGALPPLGRRAASGCRRRARRVLARAVRPLADGGTLPRPGRARPRRVEPRVPPRRWRRRVAGDVPRRRRRSRRARRPRRPPRPLARGRRRALGRRAARVLGGGAPDVAAGGAGSRASHPDSCSACRRRACSTSRSPQA